MAKPSSDGLTMKLLKKWKLVGYILQWVAGASVAQFASLSITMHNSFTQISRNDL